MAYNHAVTIAFSVVSEHPTGEDFTAAMLRDALIRRIADLDASVGHQEWFEAVGGPFDTYEE